MQEWQRQIQKGYRKIDDFPEGFLTPREREYLAGESRGELPMLITPYYFSLIGDAPDDPIRIQAVPRAAELDLKSYETADPLFEHPYMPCPRLIHRYPGRVVLLVTDFCAMYCRHCFRRSFTAGRQGPVSADNLRQVAAYLAEHSEVKEILLSGGDPLVLPDQVFFKLLNTLRQGRPDLVIRVGSRIPVVLPMRIQRDFSRKLRAFAPLWLITQFNHPRELSPVSKRAIDTLVDHGIPILNQAVLLRGVNDTVDVLEELMTTLVTWRIKPYYLFQGDLARGTAHLRVSIIKGMELMKALRKRLSGIALPVYAVDLPLGGGKIPLTENHFKAAEENWLVFEGPDGKTCRYPLE